MYVYILSNERNTTLYTGVTNDIVRRVYEHKNHIEPHSFSEKYHVTKLVYYEVFNEPRYAISREKQIKGWSRKKKDRVITEFNPEWTDLYPDLLWLYENDICMKGIATP